MSLEIEQKYRKLRWGLVAFFLLGELSLIAVAIRGSIIPDKIPDVAKYTKWDTEVVKAADYVPVQEGGRVKPFSSLARFKLLGYLGSTKVKIKVGDRTVKLGPTEWLLDCLFRPELAHQLPVFRVDDTELLKGIGVESEDRRARLTFNDFLVVGENTDETATDFGKTAVERLRDRVGQISEKRRKEADRRARMTPKQIREEEYSKTAEQLKLEEEEKEKGDFLIKLYQQLDDYQYLTTFLDFSRIDFAETDVDLSQIPEEVFGKDGRDPSKFSTWVARFGSLSRFMQLMNQQGQQLPGQLAALSGEVAKLFAIIEEKINPARGGVKWLPPQDRDNEEWWSVGQQFISVLEDRSVNWQTVEADLKKFAEMQSSGEEIPENFKAVARWDQLLKDMERLEVLVAASRINNSNEFAKEIAKWRDEVTERAEERDEVAEAPKEPGILAKLIQAITPMGEINGEVKYYNRNYFMNALVLFLIAFLISAVGWLVIDGKAAVGLRWGSVVFYILGLLYLSWGITHRSVLMGRPPVGNLYDTIPFITAGAVLVLGISELLTRRKILLSVGAVLGVAGMFLTFRYEAGNAADHMDPLVAVLKSNFWLATHVVTVTIGYSGGLMACFLSAIYAHVRLAGLSRDEKSFTRFMTRSVYGIICFTLLFSLVGTVLGGIWANDSWGRFWGWDPKENGALLIVLWSLIILHSRIAGWLGTWGIHLCSIFGGAVVGFSWWHVNMLEVGLHSYGFIKGGSVIWLFYIACLIALLVGVAALYLEKMRKAELKQGREEKAVAGKPVQA